MRVPKYLSPSAIGLFFKNRDEYYLKYISPYKPKRLQQTQPMSIGSAFDAYVKAYLAEAVGLNDPRLGFEELFEVQVESHNRDWAREHGKHVFEQYKFSGSLANLLLELKDSPIEPVFEGKLHKDVNLKEGMIEGIPLLGYPDVYYQTSEGGHVIRDWKVNGYCGKSPTSPKKGYLLCRDGWCPQESGVKRSRNHGTQHKDAWPMKYRGMMINANHPLEDVDKTWADQLTIYAWLLGEPIGGDFIVGIEQLCGTGNGGNKTKLVPIRIAAHSCKVSKPWQLGLVERIDTVWEAVQTGKIFSIDSELNDAEEIARLDKFFEAASKTGDAKDGWFANMNRVQ
jgi:hypothetical protein